VSEEPEREIDVPYELRGGVWANDVDVFGDLAEATLDFLRIDPRDAKTAVVVARVTLSPWCILTLKSELERFT
jgi:hypothetical protein